MNLNQQGCESAVSSPAKVHYYSQLFSFMWKAQCVQMRMWSEGTLVWSTRIDHRTDRLSSCGLIGIPAAHATPNSLCRVRRIEAAHIRGTSDRSVLRSVTTACGINQRTQRKMVVRLLLGDLFQLDQSLHLSVLIRFRSPWLDGRSWHQIWINAAARDNNLPVTMAAPVCSTGVC